MKKRKYVVLVMIITLLMSMTVVFAETSDLTVFVDGKEVNFPDAEPFVNKDSRTMIPVRAVSETIGATVGWDGVKRMVTIERDSTVLELIIGEKVVVVNNAEFKAMDTESVIFQDRTYVPLRFVSEFLGLEVGWDGVKRHVLIYDETSPEVEVPEVVEQEPIVIAPEVGKDTAINALVADVGELTISSSGQGAYFNGKDVGNNMIYDIKAMHGDNVFMADLGYRWNIKMMTFDTASYNKYGEIIISLLGEDAQKVWDDTPGLPLPDKLDVSGIAGGKEYRIVMYPAYMVLYLTE